MAGALQPLGMMSAILERHLQKPDPDLAALARQSSQLTRLARDASNNCMGLMTWLSPNTSDMVTLAAGIEEAVELVMNELMFKGFTVVNQTRDVQTNLPRSLTRNVFVAALMALTDTATAPANVVLAAQLADSDLVLTISIQPLQGELLPGGDVSYRNIEWEDVQALAVVESVRIVYTADRAELHCPVSVATV